MKVDGRPMRTIWLEDDGWSVGIIDQTRLPHAFETLTLRHVEDAARAISEMWVRGAPLIGATAAYGMALAVRADAADEAVRRAEALLLSTRPTAVNLRWAVRRVLAAIDETAPSGAADAAYAEAAAICDEDVATCSAIGDHGLAVLAELHEELASDRPLQVLTHCNAGWLATVDWGTALAPVYKAHEAGLPVHVWVDETRPRNQGAALTAWELGQHGVPYTVVVDNAGGHLMQHGLVDVCITGTDRTVANGDVCNKIGTYLKALAAMANEVPFYVALPHSTIDWCLDSGMDVPIEERAPSEVTHVAGRAPDGTVHSVAITPPDAPAANPAFDVTPAHLVTGLITERGVCQASREGLLGLYPEGAQAQSHRREERSLG